MSQMSRMLHCLYVYPQTVNFSKRRNLFVRVELRKDDNDIRKPPLEVGFTQERISCGILFRFCLCRRLCGLLNEIERLVMKSPRDNEGRV